MLAVLVNAYLNAPFQENLSTESGPEFGSEKGYVFLIVRNIYGLKSVGSAWRYNLVDTLNSMGHRSTDSDPEVWIKRATTYNGTSSYFFLLFGSGHRAQITCSL